MDGLGKFVYGFFTVILITTLYACAVAFAISAVAIPMAAVVRVIGEVSGLQMPVISVGVEKILSLPGVGILFLLMLLTVVLAALAYGCFKWANRLRKSL